MIFTIIHEEDTDLQLLKILNWSTFDTPGLRGIKKVMYQELNKMIE